MEEDHLAKGFALQDRRLTRLLLLAFGGGLGAYVAVLSSFVETSWLRILFLLAPLSLFSLLLFFKDAERILFAVLILTLPMSARLRPLGTAFHPGGAEAAIAPLDFPFLALLILWTTNSLLSRRRPTLRVTRLDLLFLGFIGLSALSLLNSTHIALSLYEILRLFKVFLIFLYIRHYVRGQKEINFVLLFLILGVALESVLGILQGVFKVSPGLGILGERETLWVVSYGERRQIRVGGTLGHANSLANYLELTLPLALALFFVRLRRLYRFLSLLVFAMGTVVMILTFSRAGWISLAIGVVAVLGSNLKERGVKLRRFIRSAAILGLVLGVIAALFRSAIWVRLFKPAQYSLPLRLSLIQVALEMIKAHPVVGVGINTFVEIMAQYDPTGITRTISTPVHNIYLLVLSETGILGLLAFLGLIFAILRTGFRALGTEDTLRSSVAMGLIGGLVALLGHAMLDWLFRYDVIHTLFWFQAGFLVSLAKLRSPGEKGQNLG